MIAVLFEVELRPENADRYFDLAGELSAALEAQDGFVSIERFQSLAHEGKYLSLSIWRDEAAVEVWYANRNHKAAQAEGRAAVFADYRIRVARIFRDYDMSTGRPPSE